MKSKKSTAMTPPSTGESTQLEAIVPSTHQFATPKPPAAIPAPSTPPTIECVVDTGARKIVAKCTQIAPAIKVASITNKNTCESLIFLGSIMPDLMVLTTSPPAKIAPLASQIAAIIIAPVSVIACDPTAGPTLLATSFAPMLIAI